MTLRRKSGNMEKGPARRADKAFESAFNGGTNMFSQAMEMLKSDRMADRLEPSA